MGDALCPRYSGPCGSETGQSVGLAHLLLQTVKRLHGRCGCVDDCVVVERFTEVLDSGAVGTLVGRSAEICWAGGGKELCKKKLKSTAEVVVV